MDAKEEMFLYLDDLKKSGLVNMLAARPWLIKTFDMPPARAGEILWEWLKSRKPCEKGPLWKPLH